MQFHIQYTPPNKALTHWPNGFWAVYQITGDQIAQRVQFDADGKAVRRDSWCGYVGGFGSLQEVSDAIAALTLKETK